MLQNPQAVSKLAELLERINHSGGADLRPLDKVMAGVYATGLRTDLVRMQVQQVGQRPN